MHFPKVTNASGISSSSDASGNSIKPGKINGAKRENPTKPQSVKYTSMV